MTVDSLTYDPSERHDTPLALVLKARIKAQGPLPIEDYFAACLHDPDNGYYRHARAIGSAGDFVTAPEISQCFGEIIGLWAAVVWQQMDKPDPFHLIEIGPGRGTMLRDMLRAMRVVPSLLAAVRVELVETSRTLSAVQRAALDGLPVATRWHEALPRELEHPAILVANEFLDALPIGQWQFTEAGWRPRTVELDGDDKLQFGLGDIATFSIPESLSPPKLGDILERSAEQFRFVHRTLAALAEERAFAALLVDYGHTRPAYGETLQSVRAHRHVHPLAYPGESDLTAQVDFGSICQALEWQHASQVPNPGLLVHGPISQAEFLGRLGIVERASRLMAANPRQSLEIETSVKRLLDPSGMGGRFKVIAAHSADVPHPPPFDHPAPVAQYPA